MAERRAGLIAKVSLTRDWKKTNEALFGKIGFAARKRVEVRSQKAGSKPVKKYVTQLTKELKVKGAPALIKSKKLVKYFNPNTKKPSFVVHVNRTDNLHKKDHKFPEIKDYFGFKKPFGPRGKTRYQGQILRSGITHKLNRSFKINKGKLSKTKNYLWRRKTDARLPLIKLPTSGFPSFYNIVTGRINVRPVKGYYGEDPESTPKYSTMDEVLTKQRNLKFRKLFYPEYIKTYDKLMKNYAAKHGVKYKTLERSLYFR